MKFKMLLMLVIICSNYLLAQEKTNDTSLTKVIQTEAGKQAEHLLDGSSMNYYYQGGGGIHMEFYKGMLKYEWISGGRKGNKNQDLEYNSRKIGAKMYLVSWLEASHPDYTTLVFNFNNNVMYSSGLYRFGSEKQFTRFNSRIIEDLILVEK